MDLTNAIDGRGLELAVAAAIQSGVRRFILVSVFPDAGPASSVGRDELRLGERALVVVLGLVGRLLPVRWQLNPASRIAQVLLESALEHRTGVHIITSERCI